MGLGENEGGGRVNSRSLLELTLPLSPAFGHWHPWSLGFEDQTGIYTMGLPFSGFQMHLDWITELALLGL